jgi:cephalosporin-C deacetylase-like acetyl esterase
MQEAVSIIHEGQTLRGMAHIPENREKVPAVILFHGFTGTKLEPHRMFLKISRELEKRGKRREF